MLRNPENLESKYRYKCNKLVANYLINNMHLSLLGIEEGNYYFRDSPLLREVLYKLPFWLKIIERF